MRLADHQPVNGWQSAQPNQVPVVERVKCLSACRQSGRNEGRIWRFYGEPQITHSTTNPPYLIHDLRACAKLDERRLSEERIKCVLDDLIYTPGENFCVDKSTGQDNSAMLIDDFDDLAKTRQLLWTTLFVSQERYEHA